MSDGKSEFSRVHFVAVQAGSTRRATRRVLRDLLRAAVVEAERAGFSREDIACVLFELAEEAGGDEVAAMSNGGKR